MGLQRSKAEIGVSTGNATLDKTMHRSNNYLVYHAGCEMNWQDAVRQSDASWKLAQDHSTYEDYCVACGKAGVFPDVESEYNSMRSPSRIIGWCPGDEYRIKIPDDQSKCVTTVGTSSDAKPKKEFIAAHVCSDGSIGWCDDDLDSAIQSVRIPEISWCSCSDIRIDPPRQIAEISWCESNNKTDVLTPGSAPLTLHDSDRFYRVVITADPASFDNRICIEDLTSGDKVFAIIMHEYEIRRTGNSFPRNDDRVLVHFWGEYHNIPNNWPGSTATYRYKDTFVNSDDVIRKASYQSPTSRESRHGDDWVSYSSASKPVLRWL